MKKNIFTIFIFALTGLLNGCKDGNLYFEIALPLFETKTTLEEILPSTDYIKKTGKDSLLTIVLQEDSVYSVSRDDIFTVPSQPSNKKIFKIGTLAIKDLEVNQTFTLEDMIDGIDSTLKDIIRGGANLDSALFPPITDEPGGEHHIAIDSIESMEIGGGILKFSVTNPLPTTISEIKIQLYNNDNASNIASLTLENIPPDSTNDTTVTLNNKTIKNQITAKINSISVNGTGDRPVSYTLDDTFIFNVEMSDLTITGGKVKIPNQSFIADTLSISLASDDTEAQLDFLKIKQGKLKIRYNSILTDSINLQLSIPQVTTTESDTLKENIVLLAGREDSLQINLDDMEMRLDSNNVQIIFSASIGSGDQLFEFSSTDSLSIDYSLDSLDFSYIEGFFGTKKIEIDTQYVKFQTNLPKDLLKNITLADPKIFLNIANSFGVPLQIDIAITGYSQADSITIGNIFDIKYSQDTTFVALDTLVFDSTTSNISEFISLAPDSIVYSGKITINEMSNLDSSNFISEKSALSLGLEFVLPLDMKIDNATFSDTSDFSASTNEIPEEIDSAEIQLFFNIKNQIPVNGTIQLLFTNEDFSDVLDSISLDILQKPDTDSSITEYKQKITTSKKQVKNILQAKKVISTVNVNSSNKYVKFYPHHIFNIQASIAAKININLNTASDET